jgi:hypothetical protein
MPPILNFLVTKIRKTIAANGILGTARKCVTAPARYVFWFTPAEIRNRAFAEEADLEFDRKWGVNTSGIDVPNKAEVVGSNWAFGADYQAVGAAAADDALSNLSIKYEKFTFIDFGSGKGRAILTASRFPFKYVIGVEYSEHLNDIARLNLSRFPKYEQKCGSANVVCADAVAYPIPRGPLVIFLYNPFGRQVMQQLVDNLVTSFQRNPRRMIVLYFNPVCADLWKSAVVFHETRASRLYVVYDTQVESRQ